MYINIYVVYISKIISESACHMFRSLRSLELNFREK